jgi:FKBP-type peptidyl-prolyl cis-trans isomerase 2
LKERDVVMKKRVLLAGITGIVFFLSCLGVMAEEVRMPTVETFPKVEDGKMVKIHYTLTVDGEVVDSSRGREPMEFQVGSKGIIPGFEQALMGMKVGEKKSFHLSPDEGYGQEDPKGFKEVPKNQLPPDVEPEAGMTLYAKGQNGQAFPVRIAEVKKDIVVLNFNHPLAGKTLNFNTEIIDIQ